MKKLFVVMSAIILCFAVFSGCGIRINPGITIQGGNDSSSAVTGDTKVENNNIKLEDGVKTIRTELSMGVGMLNVKGGSSGAVDAEFTYNVPSWKPEVTSSKSGDAQNISIEQPKTKNFNDASNTKYTWNIKLNNNLLQDVTLNMGVGKGNVDLKDIKLKELDVKCGVGDITLDLAGNYANDVDVTVKGGVGKSVIYVPKNMGVKVKASKGLGRVRCSGLSGNENVYTNDNYGKNSNNIDISVESGIGDITIEQK